MRGLLAAVASLCVVVLIGLSILPGPVYRLRPVGHGGTSGALVPAGYDGPDGH